MSKPKELWRRRSAFYVVEIKVGRTWVEHGRADTCPEAEAMAKKANTDRSVSGARVCGITQTTIKSVEFEEKHGPELRSPKTMRTVKGRKPCPVCKEMAPLRSDGIATWAFCVRCDRATPVAEA